MEGVAVDKSDLAGAPVAATAPDATDAAQPAGSQPPAEAAQQAEAEMKQEEPAAAPEPPAAAVEQPAAAADGPAQAEAPQADDLPLDALLLLANLAGVGPKPPGPANNRLAASRGDGPSSSGGSADTQSRLPGGGGGESPGRRPARRAAVKRRRLAEEDSDDEEAMAAASDSDGGDRLSDAEGEPLGGDDALAAASLAAAGSPAVPGRPPLKRPPKRDKPPAVLGPRKYVSSQITIQILEAEGCFNMTQVDAARHLGFGSSTVLKKVMRRLGIKQWPYRKRTSAKKITHSLEEYMRKYGDPAKVEAVLERVRMELAVYEASPTGSIPLRPELAALRQRLYKLDNKVKHEFKRDAEAPLRQCVHSLVEKTWQELQPQWMANLAQQPPAAVVTPEGGAGLPPLPLPADLGAGGDGEADGDGDAAPLQGVDAATLWALFVSQGLLAPGMPAPPGAELAAAEAPAAGQQQDSAAGAAAPETAAPREGGDADVRVKTKAGKPELSPEELALARVAALAPEPEPVATKA